MCFGFNWPWMLFSGVLKHLLTFDKRKYTHIVFQLKFIYVFYVHTVTSLLRVHINIRSLLSVR